jgi:signal transduction histidine kinase
MDTTQLNQLFDMNKSSTKGTKGEKGTGLGLLLCRDLLAANKGKIDVTSQLGKGSTFKITLPQQQGVLVA